jgi:hypothetical protein
MKSQRLIAIGEKWGRPVFLVMALVGGVGALYVGYQLFHERIRLFWIFSGYIVILTGIAIFFGFRLIEMIFRPE